MFYYLMYIHLDVLLVFLLYPVIPAALVPMSTATWLYTGTIPPTKHYLNFIQTSTKLSLETIFYFIILILLILFVINIAINLTDLTKLNIFYFSV